MDTRELIEELEKMVTKLKEPILHECRVCGKMTDYFVLIGATSCCADCALSHYKSKNA